MQRLCRVSDIPSGLMKGFVADNRQVLVANVDGNLYAVDAVCPHRGGYLPRGKLHGKILTCPVHQAQYDVTSGRVVRDVIPAVMKIVIGHTRDLRTFRVWVEDDYIMIDL